MLMQIQRGKEKRLGAGNAGCILNEVELLLEQSQIHIQFFQTVLQFTITNTNLLIYLGFCSVNLYTHRYGPTYLYVNRQILDRFEAPNL